MKNERSNLFANRLKSIRVGQKMKQSEFCQKFSIFTGREKMLPVSTLSSWEIGAKRPSYETLCQLANFFGVTIDFLIGRTSTEKETRGSKGFLFLDDYIVEIKKEDLVLYDSKPVYFSYKAGEREYGEWGIYNKRLNVFRCVEQVVKNGETFKYYACTPDSFPQPKRIK